MPAIQKSVQVGDAIFSDFEKSIYFLRISAFNSVFNELQKQNKQNRGGVWLMCER